MAEFTIPLYLIGFSDEAQEAKTLDDKFEEKFADRKEFDIRFVRGGDNPLDAILLWNTLQRIVKMAIAREEDVVAICTDIHQFCACYSSDKLTRHIIEAAGKGANILLGSVSSFGQAIPVGNGLFWIDRFEYANFLIIFRPFYQRILDELISGEQTVGLKLSEITSHKMTVYPFISIARVNRDKIHTAGKFHLPETPEMYRVAESRLRKILQVASVYHVGIEAC